MMQSTITKRVTPELQFLAACSYIPGTATGLERQKQQLDRTLSQVDIRRTLKDGIGRHRIFAIAEHVLRHHGMLDLLGDSQGWLQTQARRVRLTSLRCLAASLDIERQLSARGIRHRILKGPQLSQRVYGDSSVRHSKDIDLLVQPAQIPLALSVLQAEGWHLHDPGMWVKGGLHRRLAEYRHRHLQLVHADKRLGLELHWRIEGGPASRLEEEWWDLWDSERTEITEFAHLCLHGVTHGWSRLKWLGDIATLVDRNPEIWRAVEHVASALDLKLAMAQVRVLLHLLYDEAPPPEESSGIAASDIREMVAFALGEMGSTDPNSDLTVRTLWKRQVYRRLLHRRYSAVERFRYRTTLWLFEDNALVQLHPVLLPLMPFARVQSLVRRYLLTGAV